MDFPFNVESLFGSSHPNGVSVIDGLELKRRRNTHHMQQMEMVIDAMGQASAKVSAVPVTSKLSISVTYTANAKNL